MTSDRPQLQTDQVGSMSKRMCTFRRGRLLRVVGAVGTKVG